MISSVLIEPAIKAIATTIASTSTKAIAPLLKDKSQPILNKAGEITDAVYNLLSGASKKYIENYTQRHGCLKVLGMRREVSLDDIYINVNFKGDTLACYSTINDIEKLFRQRNYQDDDRCNALEVANQEPRLMVLGHPGSGKTTLLRKIGLEALKAGQGEYEHKCIPVLLELRRFKKEEEIDLVKAIAHEFQFCGLPEYEKITENLLKKGKLLILLDGLDEVSSDLISTMTTQIRDLVNHYPFYPDKEEKKPFNRIITSCRVAAYRNFDSFRGFTDVKVL